MAADWKALETYLRRSGLARVTMSWAELEAIVGGMPASSLNHAAWWTGDRTHTSAWRQAGYEVDGRRPGIDVTFARHDVAYEPAPTREVAVQATPGDRLLLVTCVKKKLDRPAAARDLYVSSLFRKARAYAESQPGPWYILSAQHGLVGPDEWLAPYERYLPDTTHAFREAWGRWVVARLELLEGPLTGRRIEIHASEAYLDPLVGPLGERRVEIDRPLRGLPLGHWHRWYDQHSVDSTTSSTPRRAFTGDVDEWVAALTDPAGRTAPGDLASRRDDLAGPGLYSWWVDAAGAADLSRGLGVEVEEGLIYVGQTGATRWPTGTRSGSTLQKRVGSQHLAGRRTSSTFRFTLGSILDRARGATVERADVSSWMRQHLVVAVRRIDDPDVLGDLERQVVERLDPPLNLDHVGTSAGRARLKELRRVSPRVP